MCRSTVRLRFSAKIPIAFFTHLSSTAGTHSRAVRISLFDSRMKNALHIRWRRLRHQFRKLHRANFSKHHAFSCIHTAYQKVRIFKKQADAAAYIIKYLLTPEYSLYRIECKILTQSQNVVLQTLTHFTVGTGCAFKRGPNCCKFVSLLSRQIPARNCAAAPAAIQPAGNLCAW